MRESRNFRQGGGGSRSGWQKSSDNVFVLVLSLFYRSQMVNFKEIYHFSRFQRGSNIFQGAGLEKSTRPLVFTSASGCRASGILDDFQCKLIFYPSMSIIFVMQGKCLFWDISRPGGGLTFSRGVMLLNPYRNPYTCDFPGGSGPPAPPSGSALG